MTKFPRRIDENQTEIVQYLRKLGAKVLILSAVGNGCPDLLVSIRRQHLRKHAWIGLIEIKSDAQPPSKQRLTPHEQKFFDDWEGCPVFIVKCLADIDKLFDRVLNLEA